VLHYVLRQVIFAHPLSGNAKYIRGMTHRLYSIGSAGSEPFLYLAHMKIHKRWRWWRRACPVSGPTYACVCERLWVFSRVWKFDRYKKNWTLPISLNYVKFDINQPNFDWMGLCTVKIQKPENRPNLPTNRTELAEIRCDSSKICGTVDVIKVWKTLIFNYANIRNLK
jgi:hypothetical protein